MHELSITESILSIVLDKANEAKANRVAQVNIVLGELSGVVADCVEFYFELLSKDTIAAPAKLSFRHPPTQVRCRDCANLFSPENLDWNCPACQGQKIEIISGRECYIESMEVD
ncbi:hydrogenase maturation nickel metallochaperone HypA [Chloroflexota bacterium]